MKLKSKYSAANKKTQVKDEEEQLILQLELEMLLLLLLTFILKFTQRGWGWNPHNTYFNKKLN